MIRNNMKVNPESELWTKTSSHLEGFGMVWKDSHRELGKLEGQMMLLKMLQTWMHDTSHGEGYELTEKVWTKSLVIEQPVDFH